jgi:hypothetical protein
MALEPLFLNYCFDKNRLKSLITWSLLAAGEMQTIQIVENLKQIGFQFAAKAGISLSLDDLKVPPEKLPLVSQATQQAEETQQEYQRGNLTKIERSQHLIDTWHRTSETLKQAVVNNFQLNDRLSPVYMMAFSGARGNISQVRQLAGMRGLMADPQGQIIGFPIRSNFREGLTLTEYMISCYGARKGLVDTALRTADAGYLTRRLVDVSQHMIIKTATCATSKGIVLQDLQASGKVILPLRDRLIGRVLAQDVFTHDLSISTAVEVTGMLNTRPWPSDLNFKESAETPLKAVPNAAANFMWNSLAPSGWITPNQGHRATHLLASRNQEISIELALKIASCNSRISVRSPLTCSVRHGVCQLCYGWSLSEGRLVTLGEAVGIIAAQSIGEPGTQLTMRTFHTGGVFSGDVMAEIRAPFDGVASFPRPLQGLLIRTSHGKVAFLTRTNGVVFLKKVSVHSPLKNGAVAGSRQERLLLKDQSGKTHAELSQSSANHLADTNLAKTSQAGFSPDRDVAFSLEPATVLFVRQGERVRQGQLIAEFSAIGPEVNETIEAKRTLFSEMAGQVSFASMAMGTRLKGNGEILQISKDLGFIWVLSGKRSPISPLLSVYNRGCHLVSKDSLLTRISAQMSSKSFQAALKEPKIGNHALNRAIQPEACKESEHVHAQLFEKHQREHRVATRATMRSLNFLEGGARLVASNTIAPCRASSSPLDSWGWASGLTVKFAPGVGHRVALSPTNHGIKALKNGCNVSLNSSTRSKSSCNRPKNGTSLLQQSWKIRLRSNQLIGLSEESRAARGQSLAFDTLFAKAKGMLATCVSNQSVNNVMVYDLAKRDDQIVFSFPWLNLTLSSRWLGKGLHHRSCQIKKVLESLASSRTSDATSLLDVLFVLGDESNFNDFRERGGFRLARPSHLNLFSSCSLSLSQQGAGLGWFPKRHRSDKGGFAWIDSRYISQQSIFGEMLWIEEDAFIYHLPFTPKNRFLRLNPLNKVHSNSFLSRNQHNAGLKSNRTERTMQVAGNEKDKLSVSPKMNEGKIAIDGNGAPSLLRRFTQQLQNHEGGGYNCSLFSQTLRDRGDLFLSDTNLFLSDTNLQGWQSRPPLCPVGWIKRDVLHLLNPSSLLMNSTPVAAQVATSQRIQSNSSKAMEKQGDIKFVAMQEIIRNEAYPLSTRVDNKASGYWRSSLKKLQQSNFQKVALQHSGLSRYKRGLRVESNLDKDYRTLSPVINQYARADRNDFKEKPILRPNSRLNGFNPLSKGVSLYIGKDQTLFQPPATTSWARGLMIAAALPADSRQIIETTSIGQVRALKTLIPLPKGSRGNIVAANETRIRAIDRNNSFALSLQLPPRGGRPLETFLEPIAKQFNLHCDTPGLARSGLARPVDVVQKTPSVIFHLKTGWTYWPRDNAKLGVYNNTMSQLSGGSLDSLFFDSAFVYFNALNSPAFSYHLVNTDLKLRINLKALEKANLAVTTSSWKSNTFELNQVYSFFKQVFVQSKVRANGSAKKLRHCNLSQRDVYKRRQLPPLLAWKPTSFFYNANFVSQLNNSAKRKLAQNPLARDLVLFLRKLLWLAEKSLVQSNSRLMLETRRFPLRNKQLNHMRTRMFQLLFWKDLSNHKQFLWLRAFPLQFQVIINQKARQHTNLAAYRLLDKLFFVAEDRHATKNFRSGITISKRRFLESKTRGNLLWFAEGQVSLTPIEVQRIGQALRPLRQSAAPLEPHQSAVLPSLVFVLIRKGRRHSLQAGTRGKANLLQSIQSISPLSKSARRAKAAIVKPCFLKKAACPEVIPTFTKFSQIDAIASNIKAATDSLSNKDISFQFCNKKSPTKLISKAAAINFTIKPFLAFNKFQTTSISKPIQMLRFVASSSRSENGLISKPPSSLLLMSSQVGEMLAPPPPANGGHYKAQGRNGIDTRHLATCQARLCPLANPWLTQKDLTNAALLTEADHVSLSLKHQSNGFPSDLLSVTRRSVGHFLNLGEDVVPGHSSVVPGQVVSIEKEKITLRRTQPLLFYSQGAMHVNHGEWVDKNAPILTLTYQKLVTGDIVAGIPKIEQFFEAPATKDGEPTPTSMQAKLRRTFQRLKVALPLAQAAKRSLDDIQQVLVEGILKVYLSQGVRIADKHLEVVIRQMTSKRHILTVGNTGLFQGEHVSLHRIERINLGTYGEKADYEPAVLGITQASLDSESFISAASFQETTRVLSRDTIVGKTDFLRGLKERVVLGDLIQAGTGLDDNINYGLLLGVSVPLFASERALQGRSFLKSSH